MTRTTLQKMRRWINRDTCSVFPLLRLPIELQLHVLCKCDLTSIRRLLTVCPPLVELLREYPETCLREILIGLPQPVGSLLSVSWALHCVPDKDFDPIKTLNMFSRSTNITEWAGDHAQVLALSVDPLETLDRWVDLYDEVSRIAKLYAISTISLADHFDSPFEDKILSISLSATEFTRVASAFFVLRIYYQLQPKFSYQFHELKYSRGRNWAAKFIENLDPWQKDQVMSVESFPFNIRANRTTPFDRIVRRKRGGLNDLSDNFAYLRCFERALSRHPLPYTTEYITFSTIVTRITWFQTQFTQNPPCMPSGSNRQNTNATLPIQRTSLRNHGWLYYESVLIAKGLTTHEAYKVFIDLGVFFWDFERLVEWDLTDPTRFDDVSPTLEQTRRQLEEHRYW